MVKQVKNKTIEISLAKAIAIFSGAIISAIVGTIFTTVNILNSDHYALVRIIDEVGAIKTDYVSKEMVVQGFNHLDQKFVLLEKRLDSIERKLDRMGERL